MIKEESIAALLEFSKTIGATRNLEQLGEFIVDKVDSIFQAKKASLMLLDKENKELYIWAASDKKAELKQVKVQCGQMFAGWVAQEGRPLLVKNVDSEFAQFSKTKLGRYRSKSFLIVPIKDENKTLGVINVTERQDSDIFTEEDLKIIGIIGPLVVLQMEKIKLSEQLANLVIIDSLTGLFNHRYLQEHLSEEIERAQRYRRPFSLIILGIDNFREYNENYGYAMGDCVLKQMANILKENLRKVDIASRYAGEEFVVLMPDTARKQAAAAAEKLRDKVQSAVFVEKRTSALAMSRLTASLGVAEYNIRNKKEEFIEQAEQALREAKQKGKNCVCVFK